MTWEDINIQIEKLTPAQKETISIEAETTYSYDEGSPIVCIYYTREETDEEERQMAEKRPIKLVLTQQRDYRAPSGSGGGPKPFGEVTPEIRNWLCGQLDEVQKYFYSDFEQFPELPAVAKVRLIDKATAKSHRPNRLFSKENAPIIQALQPNLLLVSLTKIALSRLKHEILTDPTIEGKHNISTIQSITPFKKDEAISPYLSAAVNDGKPIKIKLFDYHNQYQNIKLLEYFNGLFHKGQNKRQAVLEEMKYGIEPIYKLTSYADTDLERLKGFIGIQSLSPFPNYSCSFAPDESRGSAPCQLPPPSPGVDYPIVGLLDSGVADSVPSIAP